MSLGVHIIGPGYGESIVIEFPDGTAGVIDSYHHPGARAFPAHDFLEAHSKRLRTKPLRFLAVTHPHADHCLGIMRLIREFQPDQLMVFCTILNVEYRCYLELLKRYKTRDAVEASLGLPPGTIADEVYQLFDHIVRMGRAWRPGRPSPKFLRAKDDYRFTAGRLEICLRFLSPGPISETNYADQVQKAVKTAPMPGAAIDPSWSPGRTEPNLVSGGISLRFGRPAGSMSHLMLMADAETPIWAEWLHTSKTDPDLRVPYTPFLKIAHHGSENGYHTEAYREVCHSSRTLGVITPFTKQSDKPLPSKDGLLLLDPHFREIFCTNRLAAARSSGASWDPVPNEPLAVPGDWFSESARNPLLTELLSPSVGGPPTPSNLHLPRSWRKACLRRPELLHTLHPDLPERLSILGKLPAHDEFRVSLYFDEDGVENETRRFVGRGAGRLRRPLATRAHGVAHS